MKGKLLCDPVKQALLEDASNKSVMLGSETKLPLEESTKDMSMENGGVNLHLLAKNSPSHNEETVNNAALSNDKSSLRYSMVDETSKALLELPDLQCDTNNYRKSLWRATEFLSAERRNRLQLILIGVKLCHAFVFSIMYAFDDIWFLPHGLNMPQHLFSP